jgi:hypothetical protein
MVFFHSNIFLSAHAQFAANELLAQKKWTRQRECLKRAVAVASAAAEPLGAAGRGKGLAREAITACAQVLAAAAKLTGVLGVWLTDLADSLGLGQIALRLFRHDG